MAENYIIKIRKKFGPARPGPARTAYSCGSTCHDKHGEQATFIDFFFLWHRIKKKQSLHENDHKLTVVKRDMIYI